jgi:hypothetical protein
MKRARSSSKSAKRGGKKKMARSPRGTGGGYGGPRGKSSGKKKNTGGHSGPRIHK